MKTNPTSILISRRILQTTGIDAFNGIPETPITAVVSYNTTPAAAAAARRPLQPTLDPTMALTILVLLTALFLLGFFSAYIHRFAAVAEAPSPPSSASQPRPVRSKCGGLDVSVLNSLPLLAYGRAAKHPMIDDCPICLSEFHERETVKLIPYCGHVFHPSCLDTWLAGHVTCPLCRSAELFRDVEEVRVDLAPEISERPTADNGSTHEIGERSTVLNDDEWMEEGPAGPRRTRSFSDVASHAMLQRSTSF